MLKYISAAANILDRREIMEDYFAMLERHEQSIKILETDDGFRYTLQERYQYILLDEFQDTNPSQFKLVELVTVSQAIPFSFEFVVL